MVSLVTLVRPAPKTGPNANWDSAPGDVPAEYSIALHRRERRMANPTREIFVLHHRDAGSGSRCPIALVRDCRRRAVAPPSKNSLSAVLSQPSFSSHITSAT